MSIFKKKKIYRDTCYDLSAVSLAVRSGQFSFEEIASLKAIAVRYLNKCNEADARSLSVILKDFVDDSSDFGSAAVCKQIIRVGA